MQAADPSQAVHHSVRAFISCNIPFWAEPPLFSMRIAHNEASVINKHVEHLRMKLYGFPSW
jgi:hypothetical protein